jgi:hypothetical protein
VPLLQYLIRKKEYAGTKNRPSPMHEEEGTSKVRRRRTKIEGNSEKISQE